jgi:uncharacterized membrane protein
MKKVLLLSFGIMFLFTVILVSGCIKDDDSSAGDTCATATPGTKFSAVKNLMNNKCGACHSGSRSDGGFNFNDDCNLVNRKDRINQRAVVTGDMPPGGALTSAEKQIITDWLTAGGLKSN